MIFPSTSTVYTNHSSNQPINPGNVYFFTNILEGGTNVIVQSTSSGDNTAVEAIESEINLSYNNSLTGLVAIFSPGLLEIKATLEVFAHSNAS